MTAWDNGIERAMLKHLAQRMLMSVPVLLGVLLLGSPLLQLVPGDVARVNAGPTETQDVVDQIRGDLGLNKPPLVQFLLYLGRALQGDLACRPSRAWCPLRTRCPPVAALRRVLRWSMDAATPRNRRCAPSNWGHHVACWKAPIEMTWP